eukprot:gnl/Dysnectes_brevis/1214_a1357_501.p1 GENE.gnl/Dysnectes_brevis/1214_a1357_501~~gnl/Dysnectes_brevis/1214_a1357_501.p1  ORF type:complete len:226 (-),score=54.60 gnl/Dysnectes_brevis/1214_a1357_501:247-924(-)
MWRSTFHSHAKLVEHLQECRYLYTQRVIDAFTAVDRRMFVVDTKRAYVDSPQTLPCNATISAPHMHAMMLEALEPVLKPEARVLEVGSGSGVLLAYMSHLCPGGHVHGVDHMPALVQLARENLRALTLPAEVEVHEGDGRQGLPAHSPYDAIVVSAAASHCPTSLLEQLASGGRLVAPLGEFSQRLALIEKDSEGHTSEKSLGGVIFISLTSRDQQDPMWSRHPA